MRPFSFFISKPGPRPDFRQLIAYLWGDDHDVDTEGNSLNPASREWTCLWITNRQDESEAVEVEEAAYVPLLLKVSSDQDYLAARLAYALAVTTRGELRSAPDGEPIAVTSLVPTMGNFDPEAALDRLANSVYSQTTLERPYPMG